MRGWDENFLTDALLVLGLLILCTLGYKTIAWFRQDARGSARREEDALLPFRDAFEAGEISREEFQRVRDAMQRQGANRHELIPEPPRQVPEGVAEAGETPPSDRV